MIRVTGEDGIDDGGMPSTLAPADEAAFNTLVVGQRVATNFPTVYVDFVSPGRFRENQGTETYTGSYTYRNTGSDTGTVTFNYDDGDRCTASLTFDSTTSGAATSMCAYSGPNRPLIPIESGHLFRGKPAGDSGAK